MEDADRVLRGIEGIAARSFLPIVGPLKGRVLVGLVRKTRPQNILEIGTLIGYSAILMARELKDGGRLVTIEDHGDEARRAMGNARRAQVDNRVDVMVGDAKEILPALDGKSDFVFIDAEKREYLYYLQLIEGKLRPGTVLVADNAGVFADEMRDYLHYVRMSGSYSSRYVSIAGDGMEVSVRL